jgi:hypothetical protein
MQAQIKYLGYSGMDIIIAATITADQGPKTPLCVGSLIQIDEIYPKEARPALEEPPQNNAEVGQHSV